MSENALGLMWALRIEDGRRWGEAAEGSPAVDGRYYQVLDAQAIFADDGPDWHFITRPRGGSKSTDIAAVALSWLAVDARPLANGHIVASSTDQASIIIDAAAAFVARTPDLDGALVVESKRIIAPNGAWVEVLAQSDSGAWGLRDAHFLICDEFCQWPETRSAQRVWTAIRTTAPKVEHCKLIILSSSGEPSHWSYPIYQECMNDSLWRVSEMPGPVPWLNRDKLASLERSLLPSEYDRLVLNRWSESEDRAISPEAYDAAANDRARAFGSAPAGLRGGGFRSHFPVEGRRYIETIDIGIKNDATVLVVAHREAMDPSDHRGPQKVVVDHIERWQGSKKHHVEVEAVKRRAIELSQEYNKAQVYADPDQFVGQLQAMRKVGVHAEEWPFSATAVGLVASALVQTFRNGQIEVPDYPVLRDELLSVRLRESSPGVTRLDHDRSGHDDQAVTLGMACHILLAGAGGLGAMWLDHLKRTQAQQEANPAPAKPQPRPFLIGEGPPAPVSNCKHRWFVGRCAHCGKSPEEVAEMEAAREKRLVRA